MKRCISFVVAFVTGLGAVLILDRFFSPDSNGLATMIYIAFGFLFLYFLYGIFLYFKFDKRILILYGVLAIASYFLAKSSLFRSDFLAVVMLTHLISLILICVIISAIGKLIDAIFDSPPISEGTKSADTGKGRLPAFGGSGLYCSKRKEAVDPDDTTCLLALDRFGNENNFFNNTVRCIDCVYSRFK